MADVKCFKVEMLNTKVREKSNSINAMVPALNKTSSAEYVEKLEMGKKIRLSSREEESAHLYIPSKQRMRTHKTNCRSIHHHRQAKSTAIKTTTIRINPLTSSPTLASPNNTPRCRCTKGCGLHAQQCVQSAAKRHLSLSPCRADRVTTGWLGWLASRSERKSPPCPPLLHHPHHDMTRRSEANQRGLRSGACRCAPSSSSVLSTCSQPQLLFKGVLFVPSPQCVAIFGCSIYVCS